MGTDINSPHEAWRVADPQSIMLPSLFSQVMAGIRKLDLTGDEI